MRLALIILGALSVCGFAGWCFCKTAGDADRDAEAAMERFERTEDRK